MKLKRIKIPIYDYTVLFADIEGKQDDEPMAKVLKELNIDGDNYADVINAIKTEATNGGDTYRNMRMKKLSVILYPCKSEAMRRNILAHETRHVVDSIMEWINVNDIEASAYLQGWLAERIY